MTQSEDVAALLAQLADLVEPPDISWWPPAWGWWVLLATVILVVWCVVSRVKAHLLRRRWRVAALAELRTLERRAREGEDSVVVLGDLSVLLRRVALLHAGHARAARLHGEAWLALLDSLGGGSEFSRGDGRCLIDAHYREEPVSRDALRGTLDAAKKLIRRARRVRTQPAASTSPDAKHHA